MFVSISHCLKYLQAGLLVNPPPKTCFQQKLKEKKESVYLSSREAPLGKCHDLASRLPKGLDLANTTFGVGTIRGTKLEALHRCSLSYSITMIYCGICYTSYCSSKCYCTKTSMLVKMYQKAVISDWFHSTKLPHFNPEFSFTKWCHSFLQQVHGKFSPPS